MMMKNRKLWLAIKGAFILLLSFHYYYDPPADPGSRTLRTVLIIIFSISFLVDCYKFSKRR